MKIWLFTICYNEIEMMPYFLRHYLKWIDRLIVFDQQSTDGTTEMLRSCKKVTVRPLVAKKKLDDVYFSRLASSRFREARGKADWVIWVDADELVYHPSPRECLLQLKVEGVDLVSTAGYQMISDRFPTTTAQIYDEVRLGLKDAHYSKVCIFNPQLELRFEPGRHRCRIYGECRRHDGSGFKLLHFRMLGADYLMRRHAKNYARFSAENLRRRFGGQSWPGAGGPQTVEWFSRYARSRAKDVLSDFDNF